MSRKYKISHKTYSAWNYQKEIEDLNKASEQGWQLVKVNWFYSKFAFQPGIRYRYQLDYRKVEGMGRYIETFREQGWEYVESAFHGWHYFRKIYDPNLPEDAYEIFTDRQSIQEMRNRWVKLASIFAAVLAALAVVVTIMTIRAPKLPTILETVILLLEAGIMLHGVSIMRKPEAHCNGKGDGRILTLLLMVLILGYASCIALLGLRPHFYSQQQADEVIVPMVDNRWEDIEIKYADYYYLNVKMEAAEPMTFAIIDEDNQVVYAETGTKFEENDIRVRLARGRYWLSMSSSSGFVLHVSLE